MTIRTGRPFAALTLLALLASPRLVTAQDDAPSHDAAAREAMALEQSRLLAVEKWSEVLRASADPAGREMAVLHLGSLLRTPLGPGTSSGIDLEARALLAEARYDLAPRVAHLAEMVVAGLESCPPDPANAQLPSAAELAMQRKVLWSPVLRALADASAATRLHGLWWAGEILGGQDVPPDPEALAALAPLLSDPDPRVAYRAREVLRRLGLAD